VSVVGGEEGRMCVRACVRACMFVCVFGIRLRVIVN